MVVEKKLGRLQGSNKRSITSKDIMSSLSEARDDHMRQTGFEAHDDKNLQTEAVQFGFDHWQTTPMSSETNSAVPASDHWQTAPTLDTNPDPWQTTPTLDSGQATFTNPTTLSSSSDPWQVTPILDTPWQAIPTSDSSQTTPTSGTNPVTPSSSGPWQDTLIDVTPTSGPNGTGQATPTSGTSIDAMPMSRPNGAGAGKATPTSDTVDQHSTEVSSADEFEVFVNVEPVRTGCCACFHRPRRRQYSSVPRVQEQTAGLGLRGLVGIRKPRRPEDSFTAEEERAFLLKCDQLENDNDED